VAYYLVYALQEFLFHKLEASDCGNVSLLSLSRMSVDVLLIAMAKHILIEDEDLLWNQRSEQYSAANLVNKYLVETNR